ncbi:MAG: hypothetical protein JXB09_02425 [Deltaproteobacteria bacterium]|nr:hypothetical protein [Deltaproteobacteria bacterium]
MPERIYIRTENGLYRIEAEAVRIGTDLLVYIWGGDRPHIGSVAAAQPRPSLEAPSRVSATASVLTYPGHKEDVLVKDAAELLAAELKTSVVVTAGIHWENLDEAGIKEIVTLCQELIHELLKKLKSLKGA